MLHHTGPACGHPMPYWNTLQKSPAAYLSSCIWTACSLWNSSVHHLEPWQDCVAQDVGISLFFTNQEGHVERDSDGAAMLLSPK